MPELDQTRPSGDYAAQASAAGVQAQNGQLTGLAIGQALGGGLAVAQGVLGASGNANALTIASALDRLEKLAAGPGPQLLGFVSSMADTLGGAPNQSSAVNASIDESRKSGAPHLAARLHAVAGVLEGLIIGISSHASRASSAVGSRG